MNIIIDSHTFNKNLPGITRYTKNLIDNISKIDSSIKLYPYTQKSGLKRFIWGFNAQSKKHQANCIHFQSFGPLHTQLPTVNTVHDLCFKTTKRNLKTKIAYSLFFKRSLKNSNHIICPTNTVKRNLNNYYPFTKNIKTSIIPYAPSPTFKPIKITSSHKKTLTKFNINNKFFLVVGDIRPHKQPDKIIKAFSKLQNQYPKTQLVFVGKNYVKSLESLNPKLFKSHNVIVLENIGDKTLNIFYNLATALIAYSKCEGFGLPVVEAMTAGCPVVCNSIPVYKELHRNYALFAKNTVQFSKHLSQLIKNKSLRTKYTNLGIKHSKKFSWKKIAKETVNIYQTYLITK